MDHGSPLAILYNISKTFELQRKVMNFIFIVFCPIENMLKLCSVIFVFNCCKLMASDYNS